MNQEIKVEVIKAYDKALEGIEREINYIEYLRMTDETHFTNNPISALKSVRGYIESCKNSLEPKQPTEQERE